MCYVPQLGLAPREQLLARPFDHAARMSPNRKPEGVSSSNRYREFSATSVVGCKVWVHLLETFATKSKWRELRKDRAIHVDVENAFVKGDLMEWTDGGGAFTTGLPDESGPAIDVAGKLPRNAVEGLSGR